MNSTDTELTHQTPQNTTFKDLQIIEPILKAIKEKGYTQPSPIQVQSIPILLNGEDLLGCAQTGTGKTAAFTIPIIQSLYNNQSNYKKNTRKIKALIITPTRELAKQIADNISLYAKFTNIRNTVVFGGVRQNPQTTALKRGVDILVATPGRLLDLMNQGYINLDNIEHCVLDEADHMLDMGFIDDIQKIIVTLPQKRQSLFFSATMPPAIVALSHKMLKSPKKITIAPEKTTAEKVTQKVYMVNKHDKTKLLLHIIKDQTFDSILIFSRTKHGADKIVQFLKNSDVKSAAIHGNKTQNVRQKTLKSFQDYHIKILVATDIAARGIDVKNLSLVINYDLPNVPETYIHRIGRTGRADASGIAISFCSKDEKPWLRSIQKLINKHISVISDHPFADNAHESSNDGSQRFRKKNSSFAHSNSPRSKNLRPPHSRSSDNFRKHHHSGQLLQNENSQNKFSVVHSHDNNKKVIGTQRRFSRDTSSSLSYEKNDKKLQKNFNKNKENNLHKRSSNNTNKNYPPQSSHKKDFKYNNSEKPVKKNYNNATLKNVKNTSYQQATTLADAPILKNRKERRKHLQPKFPKEVLVKS